MDSPGSSVVKSLPANVGTDKFDPWVGKIPWRRKRNPLQYSFHTVHGVGAFGYYSFFFLILFIYFLLVGG